MAALELLGGEGTLPSMEEELPDNPAEWLASLGAGPHHGCSNIFPTERPLSSNS